MGEGGEVTGIVFRVGWGRATFTGFAVIDSVRKQVARFLVTLDASALDHEGLHRDDIPLTLAALLKYIRTAQSETFERGHVSAERGSVQLSPCTLARCSYVSHTAARGTNSPDTSRTARSSFASSGRTLA